MEICLENTGILDKILQQKDVVCLCKHYRTTCTYSHDWCGPLPTLVNNTTNMFGHYYSAINYQEAYCTSTIKEICCTKGKAITSHQLNKQYQINLHYTCVCIQKHGRGL